MSAQEYPITVQRDGDGPNCVIAQQQGATWTEEILVFDSEQASGVVRGLVAIYGVGILPAPEPASTEPEKPAEKPADKPAKASTK